jgi:Ca2+-transporting ATPase
MFYGFLIAGISLTAFFQLPCAVLREQGVRVSFSAFTTVLQNPEILGRAQTYAFTVLGLSQLFHAVGMRDRYKSFFQMNHLENKLMIAAFIIGLGLQVAVTEVPFLTVAFDTAHLSMAEWFRLIILAAFPLLAHELLVLLYGKEQQTCPIGKTNKML